MQLGTWLSAVLLRRLEFDGERPGGSVDAAQNLGAVGIESTPVLQMDAIRVCSRYFAAGQPVEVEAEHNVV